MPCQAFRTHNLNVICAFCSVLELTSSQKQNSIDVSIQRQLLVDGHPDIVDTPLEQEWPHPDGLDLAGH